MSLGLSEFDFWEMTFLEIEHYITAQKEQQKMRASFDYMLADLIGFSIARLQNSNNKMPTLAEAYPTLFDREQEREEIAKRQDELSALRFRQFADAHNKKMKGVV